MKMYTLNKLNIKINIMLCEVGNDLCLIISGGDKPHIGCVTLSYPRPSNFNETTISCTTSILNLSGHKDDIIARYVSEKLSSKLNKNVVVSCGIHVEEIKTREIETIIDMTKELTLTIINDLNN